MASPVPNAPIWLTTQRDYWWGRLVLPALICIVGGSTVGIELALSPERPAVFFFIMGAGASCFVLIEQALAKWVSEPVTVSLAPDSLVGCFTNSGRVEKVFFVEIRNYQFRTTKESSRLIFTMQNGDELTWQARHKVSRFQKMVREFELEFKKFRWKHQQPQGRPRY